jgi:thiamine biosynthesis protein ThiS
MILLNGKKVKNYSTIENLLKENKFNLNNVSVVVNEKVIKKSEWKKYKLKDGDAVEVLGFVGGG